MDPLTALREFAMHGELERISESGGELHFGSEYSFPCGASTGFRSKNGGYYSLETLLFFLRHRHLKHTDYLQSARLHHLPAVTLPDRKPLLDYLLGLTASSAAISIDRSSLGLLDEYRPEEAPPFPDPGPDPSLAPAAPLLDTADYVSMIRALERPLKDREALLQAKNRDFYALLLASTKRQEDRNRHSKDAPLPKTRGAGTGTGTGRPHDDRADDKAAPSLSLAPKPPTRLKGVPIILVPSASQTLITIYNVRDFLEDGIYVPSDVKAKAMKGSRPDCVTVQKKLSR